VIAMTATVITFTRDWQGPAREIDTWVDQRIVSGRYPEPDVGKTYPIGPALVATAAFLGCATMFAAGVWSAILLAQAIGWI
jgi:hypothetical protein